MFGGSGAPSLADIAAVTDNNVTAMMVSVAVMVGGY